MFLTYLRRELTNRKKQTVIIAIGMALAIALVIIVSSIASGVKSAQATALQSVYGVGTDITVSKTSTPSSSSSGRPNFSFGSKPGSSSGSGKTNLSQSKLSTSPGTGTISESDVTKVKNTAGVSKAMGVLTLSDTSFSGSLKQSSGSSSSQSTTPGGSSNSSSAPSGGGFGGGSFNVDSFTVTGLSTSSSTSVGPLSSAEVTKGRGFKASDAGDKVAVLDKAYAKTESKSVGDTITIGGSKFTIIGIVKSTGSSSTTATNAYIPLDVAQSLSDNDGKVTSIYVSATSSGDVSSIKSALEKKLSGTTVSTESDLASTISGSLSTASSLVSKLGTWLSIVVLAAAFLIAILFTISGVSRRTREFGTLKAIGWSNGRITRQVAGESVIQGIIGGVVGTVVGLIGILVVNIISPTISSSTSGSSGAMGGGQSGGGMTMPSGAPNAGGGMASSASTSSSDVVLHAPVTIDIILVAIGLSILGGLIAGALGGWRASKLRPAEALRSVA